MATKMICDLCQGPIEPDTPRGCIHLPKLVSHREAPTSPFEMMFQQQQERTLTIQGRTYTLEDLDICEYCVGMIKQMRRTHPAGRQS